MNKKFSISFKFKNKTRYLKTNFTFTKLKEEKKCNNKLELDVFKNLININSWYKQHHNFYGPYKYEKI